jgi:hypothetical protein
MTGRHDLHIEQGATFTAAFEWHEDTAEGALIDTADYVPHMQIRTRYGGTVLAEFTTGAGLDADGGIITLRIGADVTAALPQGGVYDLELHRVDDDTDVVRLIEGRVVLAHEVTKEEPAP